MFNGQSEHQSLTRPEEHVELLDSFAGLKAEGGLRDEMALKRTVRIY